MTYERESEGFASEADILPFIKPEEKDYNQTDEEVLLERWKAHQESIYHVTGPSNDQLIDRKRRTFNITLSNLQTSAKQYYKKHPHLFEKASEEEFIKNPWDYIDMPDNKSMQKAA